MMTFDPGDGSFYGDGTGPHTMLWADETSGRQTIETTVTNFGQGTATDYLTVVMRHCGGDPDCGLKFRIARTGSPDLWHWTVNWIDGAGATIDFATAPAAAAWPFTDPFTIRGESNEDGSYVFMINSSVVVQRSPATVPISPSRVGFELDTQVGGTSIPVNISTSAHLGGGEQGVCIDDVSFFDDFLCAPLPPPDPVPPDAAPGSVWLPQGESFADSQLQYTSAPRSFECSALTGFSPVIPKLYIRCGGGGATPWTLYLAFMYVTLANPLDGWTYTQPRGIDVTNHSDDLIIEAWPAVSVSTVLPTAYRFSRQTSWGGSQGNLANQNTYYALGLLLEPA